MCLGFAFGSCYNVRMLEHGELHVCVWYDVVRVATDLYGRCCVDVKPTFCFSVGVDMSRGDGQLPIGELLD